MVNLKWMLMQMGKKTFGGNLFYWKIAFSLLIDKIGYKTAMVIAFLGDIVWAVMGVSAYMISQNGDTDTAFKLLYWGSLILALSNGTVEARWGQGNVMTTSDMDQVSTIFGGRAADTFHVYETRDDGEITYLDGQQGNDKYVFYAEDGDVISALVNDQGNDWDNDNVIEARGTTGADTITVTDVAISLAANQNITYVSPAAAANVMQIKVKSRQGGDQINIKSTNETVAVTAFTGAGDDTVTVGDKSFTASRWMRQQALDFVELLQAHGDKIAITSHGGGLLAALLEHHRTNG